MTEEVKINAIVIKSNDYKDKDKVVTLFSLELGLISVILKNCKGASYKLKFAYNPFSFAEFEIIKKDEIFFVKNAYLIENFFDITKDYDRFVLANNILEIILKTNKTLEPNSILFINALKAFNILANEDIFDNNILLIKFMLGTIKVNGFKLNFNSCSVCELPFFNKVYLNLENGSLECNNCRSEYSVIVEKDVFELLKKVNSKEITDLSMIDANDKVSKSALKLLILDIENRFNIKLNTHNYI